MYQQFLSIFSKTQNIIITGILSLFLFVIIRIAPEFTLLRDFFALKNISAARRGEVFWEHIFSSLQDMTIMGQILSTIFPLLIVVNVIIFTYYIRRQRKILSARGTALSFSGVFLGFFGVGCISCGTLLFAPLLSLLGLGGLINYGTELSFVGLVFIFGSSLYLLRQLSKPMVC